MFTRFDCKHSPSASATTLLYLVMYSVLGSTSHPHRICWEHILHLLSTCWTHITFWKPLQFRCLLPVLSYHHILYLIVFILSLKASTQTFKHGIQIQPPFYTSWSRSFRRRLRQFIAILGYFVNDCTNYSYTTALIWPWVVYLNVYLNLFYRPLFPGIYSGPRQTS